MIGDDAQREQGERSRARASRSSPRAFTLLEILVSISIIAVLLSLLLPAITGAVAIARSRKCQAGQRSVGFDFSIFADDSLHPFRGQNARPNSFQLSAFINAQYQIGEFWAWGNVNEIQLPAADGHDPMRCPEISGPVTLFRGRQATSGGIGPLDRISYGFNIRLHMAEVRINNGPPQARSPINIGGWLLESGADKVPLMWDIDPLEAGRLGVNPLLSGPSAGNTGIFSHDRYWFPAARHHRMGNYLFLDGHVEESSTPLNEGWNWAYSPLSR